MNELFKSGEEDKLTPQTLEEGQDYYSQLVGDGKKFNTGDPEKDKQALAKSKLESDMFIDKLLGETAGLREQLKQSVTLEKFLEKIQESREASTDTAQNVDNTDQRINIPGAEDRDNISSLSNEDVKKLINDVVQEQVSANDLRRTYENNVERVHTKAREVLGDDYQYKLNQRAKDLNLDVESLSELASKNPQGFINIMIDPKTAQSNLFSSTPSSEINSAALSNTKIPIGAKPKSYFDKIKEEDPVHYWSPQVQVEMHQAAKELGIEKFNNN